MPGFSPIGSTPVASIGGGSSPSGTTVTPGLGAVSLSGFITSFSGTNPVKANILIRETLSYREATARVDVIIRESLSTAAATARVDVIIRESLSTAAATAKESLVFRESLVSSIIINSGRVNSIFREALTSHPLARAQGIIRETLMSSTPAPVASGGFISILW